MKKVLALLLVAVLCLGCFAACGGNGNNEDPANKADGENYAANNTEYVIGCTGPLTGDTASYGISVQNGAQIAIEEINANGGLNGIKFKFDMKDDKATAADAQTGYDALYEAGMQVSIGSVTSGSAKAFGEKAAEDNVFFMTPSASAANVIECGDNCFRVCFGDPDQGTIAAEELTAKYKNIGCIYDSSDAYSAGIYDAFKAKMDELKVEFNTQSFDAENKKDFSTQAEALKDCDVVFLPIYYTEAGLIAKAFAAKGSEADIFGSDGLDGVADQIDETVTANIKYITPFDVNSEEGVTAKFVKAYKEKYDGATPDQFAADGYDAIMAIYEAMKAAGVNDVTIAPSELCDKLVAAVTAEDFKLVGATGEMTWDATGACTKVPQIVELN
ncbi:MAG: ABC transporter substrate-binding protein [Clostridia bacterium]|nr:ABC transporter substrate-binding protein [Clostridia bacterium]